MSPDAALADLDDASLLTAFRDLTLPSAAWTHRAHVRVGALHLVEAASNVGATATSTDDVVDVAHVLSRVGIIRLNASHALVETPERGYHETITRAWLVRIRRAIATHHAHAPFVSTFHLLERAPELLQSQLLLQHYSRERLLSLQARASWLPPDLAQL